MEIITHIVAALVGAALTALALHRWRKDDSASYDKAADKAQELGDKIRR